MTLYRFEPASGQFIIGLPATDLDDTTLPEEQKVLLKQGVKAGLYHKLPPTHTTLGDVSHETDIAPV